MTTRTDTLKVRYEIIGNGDVVQGFANVTDALGKQDSEVQKLLANHRRLQDELDKGGVGRRRLLDQLSQLRTEWDKGAIGQKEFYTEARRATLEYVKQSDVFKVVTRAAVVGFGAAATGLGIYIKNTIAAGEVQTQLAARIKDTGGVAGRSLAQLNEQAERLQKMKLTVFDGEAIGNAQAMLLTFKQIQGVNFDRALETSLDLATALKTDLPSAARTLGAALEDPERGLQALSRAGIRFTEYERGVIKAMMDAGDQAAAQRLILDKLEGSIGSAAEAARNNLGGAFKALAVTVNNLLQGDSGSDGMRGLRGEVEDLIDTLNREDVKTGTDSLASGLLHIANVALQAASGIGNFLQSYYDLLANQGKVGASAGQTLDQLLSRQEQLTQFQGRRNSRSGLSGAGDPIAKLLGIDVDADVQGEIDRTQQLIKDAVARSGFAGMPLFTAPGTSTTAVPFLPRDQSFDLLSSFVPDDSRYVPAEKKKKKTGTSTDPTDSLLARIREQIALNEEQAKSEDKLTTSERLHIEVTAALAEMGGKATGAKRALIEAALKELDISGAQAEAAEREAKAKEQLARLTKQLTVEEDNRRAANAADLAELGHGEQFVQQMRRRLDIERDYAEGLKELRDRGVAENTEAYRQQESALRASRDRMLAEEMEYQQKRLAAEMDWSNGARAALEDFEAKANDVAGATRDAIGSGLDGAADEITNFVTKGKANFSDLFESVIADFVRMESRILMSKALEWLSGLFGVGVSAGTASGAFGAGANAGTSSFVGPRAGGGGVQGAGMYEVAEQGNPELLRVGGKTYLMMGPDSGEVTPARLASTGGAGGGTGGGPLQVQVNITNKGQPVQAQQTGMRQDGNRLILDMVLDAVAGDMTKPGGKINTATAQAFGLSRRGVPVAG